MMDDPLRLLDGLKFFLLDRGDRLRHDQMRCDPMLDVPKMGDHLMDDRLMDDPNLNHHDQMQLRHVMRCRHVQMRMMILVRMNHHGMMTVYLNYCGHYLDVRQNGTMNYYLQAWLLLITLGKVTAI